MNKQKIILLTAGVFVISATLILFFSSKISTQNAGRPLCNPLTTDCSKVTPLGTTYTPPPKEENLVTNVQSGKIDEHLTIDNTLRDVNFCGKVYQVKQVFIDGVDVVQRIADLVRSNDISSTSKGLENLTEDTCKSVPFNQQSELNIGGISVYASDLPIERINAENKTYGIFTPIFQVAVNPSRNEIYSINGFDGSTQFVAKLQ